MKNNIILEKINIAITSIICLILTILFILFNKLTDAQFNNYVSWLSLTTLVYFSLSLIFSFLKRQTATIIQSSRLFLGIVFIFSGFVKAIDPIGFGYKLGDYFLEAFHQAWLMPSAFPIAIFLISLETIVGLALMFNIRTKQALLAALAFMAFFLPLTLYLAISNAVKDCGCFGDAFIVTNWETFWKNVFISIFTVALFFNRKSIKNSGRKFLEWGIISGFSLGILLFQYYNYAHLPMLDFRPYKKGSNLVEKMKEIRPPKFVTWFLMKNLKTGKEEKVDTDKYMKIWQDTLTWKLIKTLDNEMIDPGIPAPIHDFRLISKNGDEITDIILGEEKTLLVVAYNLKNTSLEGIKKAAKLASELKNDSVKTYLLTASITSDVENILKDIKSEFEIVSGDETMLKTIIRSNPGFLTLKKGVVLNLWHYNDIPDKRLVMSNF